MTKLRHLGEDDVPAVAALFRRVYPHHRWDSPAACESYFRAVLLHNPWRDPEIPTWVAEDQGRICGLYAVLPRRMLLHGRPIRVAVGCQAMVDPDHRDGLTALQLIKACLAGPQDLTLADGATDQARRLWLGIGGEAPLLYSLHWTRLLRPARYVLSLVGKHAALPALTRVAHPFAAVADALSARVYPNRFQRADPALAEEMLEVPAMLSALPAVLKGSALRPVYDAPSLAWLLGQAASTLRHGQLRARALRDRECRLVGWYLYFARRGAVGEVLQVTAERDHFDAVLRRLLADAWRQGCTALRGRLDPRFAPELSVRHCWLRMEGPWTLVHSRHADVLDAIRSGTAFLTRLEGEWWLRFLGE